jgi:hypothetical protein
VPRYLVFLRLQHRIHHPSSSKGSFCRRRWRRSDLGGKSQPIPLKTLPPGVEFVTSRLGVWADLFPLPGSCMGSLTISLLRIFPLRTFAPRTFALMTFVHRGNSLKVGRNCKEDQNRSLRPLMTVGVDGLTDVC